MKVIRDFGEYFKYSLHDARINRIEYKQGNIILHFNYIFGSSGIWSDKKIK